MCWYESELHGFVHTECVDWLARTWPFECDVAFLRTCWKALKEAIAVMESVGRWVRQFEQRWPEGAAQGVEEWTAIKKRITTLIKDLEK